MSALEVAAAVSVVAGGALHSAVGFGFALACAPLVFAAFGPQEAVGLLILLGVVVNFVSLLGEGRRPEPLGRLVAVLLGCAVPGMVAGAAVLRSVDAVVLQAAVTVLVLSALVVRRVGAEVSARRGTAGRARSPAWAVPTGLLAGVLTTTTSTAGPPLVLLLLGRGLRPEQVRDTLMACFIGLGLLGAAVLAVTGTRGAVPGAAAVAVLVPLAIAGQVAGRPLFARLADRHYEPALTAVLVCAAVAGLVTAVA